MVANVREKIQNEDGMSYIVREVRQITENDSLTDKNHIPFVIPIIRQGMPLRYIDDEFSRTQLTYLT